VSAVERSAGDPEANGSVIGATPGLLRLAAGAWWRTAEWTLATSVRAGSRMLDAAVNGQSPVQVLEDAGIDVRAHARRLLGLAANGGGSAEEARRDHEASLRDRGAELLRRSADVRFEDDSHPAYDHILGQLAPDEGRILRLLATAGPQPSIDVRGGPPLASRLVAPGLQMIGAEAGCRHVDRVHAYLNNLYRLGLVWFSREPLGDPLRYQVLEAQPEVLGALREAGRFGRTMRRSIHLTPFGADFCSFCLPLDTAELEALPSEPPDEPGPPLP
jgi:hypothetical protein